MRRKLDQLEPMVLCQGMVDARAITVIETERIHLATMIGTDIETGELRTRGALPSSASDATVTRSDPSACVAKIRNCGLSRLK